MALEGKIKDFGVAEILQLIGQQQKTGVLIIKGKKNKAEISLKEGMIVAIDIEGRRKRDAVGDMLVKANVITKEELKKVLKIQEDTLSQLGKVLLKLEKVNKEILRDVLSIQIHERIYHILQWKEGKYHFDARPLESYEQLFSPLHIEHILIGALQMIDEWPAIKRKIAAWSTTLNLLRSFGFLAL